MPKMSWYIIPCPYMVVFHAIVWFWVWYSYDEMARCREEAFELLNGVIKVMNMFNNMPQSNYIYWIWFFEFVWDLRFSSFIIYTTMPIQLNKGRAGSLLDLTPMIDMVFLLLIFFIVLQHPGNPNFFINYFINSSNILIVIIKIYIVKFCWNFILI